ncbi:triosephosphate isomerase [Desulforhopalus vacuolatus]|uniref:triose-phosphate isomerase n=1 Tax=Desulforhopalus vacuolatus TaxID=40414 RepID=UPI0019649E22|nr:triose-phosphate isomerase family protein [Desulforhopalus vacuolatus]MBM9518421.1 triosephosphate isomerase [Desulforhopalus vacuolatus]
MKYITGNWKSNKTTAEGLRWLEQFAGIWHPGKDLSVVIAPPMVSIESLAAEAKHLRLEHFFFAAQDLSPFPRGSYTGAVAADLLKGVVQYAIVGHNERRRYFQENVQDALNKAAEAVDAGIVPLVCVADVAEVSRLSSLADLNGRVMLAYTPTDPAVSGIPESAEKITGMVTRMKRAVPGAIILYGGAVTGKNAAALLAVEGVDGLFVGKASLDPANFAAVCAAAA